MKLKNLQDFRQKKVADLVNLIADKKKEAALTFAKIRAGKEKNTSKARLIRKDIAQMESVVSELKIIERIKGGETK